MCFLKALYVYCVEDHGALSWTCLHPSGITSYSTAPGSVAAGRWTSSTSTTWELVRNAKPQAPRPNRLNQNLCAWGLLLPSYSLRNTVLKDTIFCHFFFLSLLFIRDWSDFTHNPSLHYTQGHLTISADVFGHHNLGRMEGVVLWHLQFTASTPTKNDLA